MRMSVIYFVAGLLIGAGGVLGQEHDLPLTPIWSYEFNGWNGAWVKDSWVENGRFHFLINLKDNDLGSRAEIISEGEMLWRSPRGLQEDAPMRRVHFSEGPAIVIGNNTGSGAFIGRYDGEAYSNSELFRFGDRPGGLENGTGYDVKAIVPINTILPEPNDSGVIIGLDEWTQNYDLHNDFESGTLNGGLNFYRFQDQRSPSNFALTGGVDRLIEKRDDEGFIEYLICRSITSDYGNNWNETATEWVSFNRDLSVHDHVETSGEFVTTFAPEVDGRDLVCSIHYTYEQAFLKVITAPQLETVYFDAIPRLGSMRALCHYFDPSNQAGHHYLLITSAETAQVIVFDLSALRLLGSIYQMPQSVIWMQCADFVEGGNVEIAVLTPMSFTLYEIAPLSISSSQQPLYPKSLSLAAFPSPFNFSTFVTFSTPSFGRVNFSLTDNSGRTIRRWNEEILHPGEVRISIDGKGLTAGTYWVNVEQNGMSATRKVVMVK